MCRVLMKSIYSKRDVVKAVPLTPIRSIRRKDSSSDSIPIAPLVITRIIMGIGKKSPGIARWVRAV